MRSGAVRGGRGGRVDWRRGSKGKKYEKKEAADKRLDKRG